MLIKIISGGQTGADQGALHDATSSFVVNLVKELEKEQLS